MPNWCNNYLTLTGPYDDVKRFFDEAQGDKDAEGKGDILSFEKHVPMTGPEENWYQEHCDKWGTKWDACDSDVHSEDVLKLDSGDGEISYSFSSAWAPPVNWFAAVVPQFPTIEFELQYEEPGCECYGVSSGSNGEFSDTEMSKEEWLIEMNEEYPEYLADIKKMTQADLIKFFSGVNDFDDCCQDSEEWNDALKKDYNWDSEMYDFTCLATHIVNKIEAINLPMFINTGWGEAADLFKERLSKGE